MRPARLVILLAAFASGALGCQWIFPLHESAELENAADAGGPDASVEDDTSAASGEAGEGSDAAPTDAAAAPADSASPGSDAGTCDRPITYHLKCDECLQKRCCSEVVACFVTNPECPALGQCVANCGFDFVTCPANCARDHDAGVDDYNRINRCADGYCKVECGKDAGT